MTSPVRRSVIGPDAPAMRRPSARRSAGATARSGRGRPRHTRGHRRASASPRGRHRAGHAPRRLPAPKGRSTRRSVASVVTGWPASPRRPRASRDRTTPRTSAPTTTDVPTWERSAIHFSVVLESPTKARPTTGRTGAPQPITVHALVESPSTPDSAPSTPPLLPTRRRSVDGSALSRRWAPEGEIGGNDEGQQPRSERDRPTVTAKPHSTPKIPSAENQKRAMSQSLPSLSIERRLRRREVVGEPLEPGIEGEEVHRLAGQRQHQGRHQDVEEEDTQGHGDEETPARADRGEHSAERRAEGTRYPSHHRRSRSRGSSLLYAA